MPSKGKDLPETDPDHPRLTTELRGQGDAEKTLIAAWQSGRMPHAWLITGPKGIGKATLAYRFARFLFSEAGTSTISGGDSGLFGDALPVTAPDSLAMNPEDPVFGRVASGAHGNLLVIERGPDPKTGKIPAIIPVDNVRRVHGFFEKTAAEGGWRVAIVDAADEMNRNAANALLKTLEEPPKNSVLLLVAHRPGILPATVRSRCRLLEMRPLPEVEIVDFLKRRAPDTNAADLSSLARLSQGSPGRALALTREGGIALYREMLTLLGTIADKRPAAAHALADRLAPKKADARYHLFVGLLLEWLSRFIRAGALGTEPQIFDDAENGLAQKLAELTGLERWVEVWDKVGQTVERAEALNLDRKQVVLSLVFQLESAVARS